MSNGYYRIGDRYVDNTTPSLPVEYLCTGAGTNATSTWAKITGSGSGGGTATEYIFTSDGGDYLICMPSGTLTTLSTGFSSGVSVGSVVANYPVGIAVGQQMSGIGVPVGVYVLTVDQASHTVTVTPFTSTAASSGQYGFGNGGLGGQSTALTGFVNGATVTSLIVASTTGIIAGQSVTGTGIPTGVTVSSINTTTNTVTVSSFTATANSAGNYTFGGSVVTTLTGFVNGATVGTLLVATTVGLGAGQQVSGTGIPTGVFVQSVNTANNTVTVTSFTATAASSGSYTFVAGYINIAKPPKIRTSVITEIAIDGTGTHTFTYTAILNTSSVTVGWTRTNTWGGGSGSQTEEVTPAYLVGDAVYATAIPTTYLPTAPAATSVLAISLLDIHDKDWAT